MKKPGGLAVTILSKLPPPDKMLKGGGGSGYSTGKADEADDEEDDDTVAKTTAMNDLIKAVHDKNAEKAIEAWDALCEMSHSE